MLRTRQHQHRTSFEVWISSRRLINKFNIWRANIAGWLVSSIVIIRYCGSAHCFRCLAKFSQLWVCVCVCIKLYAMSSSFWMTHDSTFIGDDLSQKKRDGWRFHLNSGSSAILFSQMLMDFNWNSSTKNRGSYHMGRCQYNWLDVKWHEIFIKV